MEERGNEPPPSLDGLLGAPAQAVRERLGPPRVDRRLGRDRWLVVERPGVRIRIRTRAGEGGEERVASWSVAFSEGRHTLREAAEPLGLWPACAPDQNAASAGPLLRRPLPSPDGDAVHSLTARVRGGRIDRLAGFDEPPEWLEETP